MKNIEIFFKLTTLLIVMFGINIANANINEFNGCVNLTNVELGKTKVNGAAKLKHSTFTSLEVNGALHFQDLTGSGDVVVNGAIDGNHMQCKQLKVAGALKGDNIVVQQQTTVFGALNVDASSLGELTVSAHKMIFNNSTVNNILIKKLKYKRKQRLILKGDKTIIYGNITFEQVGGEILIQDKAKIMGKVYGGKIINI